MWVVDRKNLKVIEVPDDYRECSICFAWKPLSDFKNEGEEHISRTNCHDCFMLPMAEFTAKRQEAEEYREFLRKTGKMRMVIRSLEVEKSIRKNGVSKDKVREWFEDLLERIPDDAVVDCTCGDIEVEQTFTEKPLFRLKFSAYDEDGGFWG